MPRSAPLASASLIVCFTRSGPSESATTSPPCFSLRRKASSKAKVSGSFISKLISVSRIQAPSAVICSGASLAGTCLVQTAIFTLRTSLAALEYQRRVGAAETEGVRKHAFEGGFAGLVRYVVEIARRVGELVVNGRRQDLIAQCEHADTRFEAAGAAEQVAGHGFCGTDRQAVRVVAEDALDGNGFDGVAQGRGRAVCVDVSDLFGSHARVAQRL